MGGKHPGPTEGGLGRGERSAADRALGDLEEEGRGPTAVAGLSRQLGRELAPVTGELRISRFEGDQRTR